MPNNIRLAQAGRIGEERWEDNGGTVGGQWEDNGGTVGRRLGDGGGTEAQRRRSIEGSFFTASVRKGRVLG